MRTLHLEHNYELIYGLKTGKLTKLWAKCYYLLAEMVPMGYQNAKGGGALFINMFYSCIWFLCIIFVYTESECCGGLSPRMIPRVV